MSAEADLCPRLKCPHFDRCFLFRARRRAAEADVVVVNHHLLAADLSVRRAQDNWEDAAVLPPYKRLVLDEGHHLEEVAASHLGVQVTSRMVRRLLSRFERNNRGLAPTLLHDLAGRTDQPSRESAELLRERLFPALADARRASDAMLVRLYERLAEAPSGQLRLGDDFAVDAIWDEGLAFELDATLTAFRALREVVEMVADRLAQADDTERRGRALSELGGGVTTDGRHLGRPQPDAASGSGRTVNGALDGAQREEPERAALRRAAGSRPAAARAPIRSAGHGRAHQRHPRRRAATSTSWRAGSDSAARARR